MKPVVLIHIEEGVPSITGVQVFFLDFDSFDPHLSYYSKVVEIPLSESQIIDFINSEINETDSSY